MSDDRQTHWENVYLAKADRDVSWYEGSPTLSLQLMADAGVSSDAVVVEVGGGASQLVDHLIAMGQAHVTVLDLSAAALGRARSRLGKKDRVNWVVSDITKWNPARRYDVWHDRAAFHFLTEPADQSAYLEVLRAALRPGGIVIIGTFAPDGPEKCSGLPVARQDAESLQALLGDDFRLLMSRRHEHHTPSGSVQKFHFGVFRYQPSEKDRGCKP
ncbi:MAG: class I SAM-dependent methyltransferase [Alphaproteobacteria bacterium]|nr:class I SAM-dependent methyltransferase [Alphaproteobacteria bacterium]